MVHALLVFDILKKLVTRFSAKDVELVLLVLKNVGFALRKDDPLALKELISEAQRKANTEGQRFQDQTRVRHICHVKKLSSVEDRRSCSQVQTFVMLACLSDSVYVGDYAGAEEQ